MTKKNGGTRRKPVLLDLNPRGECINNEAGYGQGDRGNESLRLDEERERRAEKEKYSNTELQQ